MWKAPFRLAVSLFFGCFWKIVLAMLPFALAECLLIAYLNYDVFNFDPETWDSWRSDSLISFLFTPFWTLAVLFVVRKKRQAQPVVVGEALRFIFSRTLPLLAALFMVNLLVGVGFLALVVPGIYLIAKYFLIAPVVAFGEFSLITDRERSGQLMAGRMVSTLIISAGIFVAWMATFLGIMFVVYLVFPYLSIWWEAVITAVFGIPYAFITVYSFAIYVTATESDDVEDEMSERRAI